MTDGMNRVLVRNRVDVHAHITDPAALAEMARLAPELVPTPENRDGAWYLAFPGQSVERAPDALFDLALRFRDMDEQGIGYQALACWTWLYLYQAPAELAADLLEIQNDSIIRICREHPDRFVAMPGLPMQDIRLALKEVDRLADINEVAGVQISTNINQLDLDDPSFEPVWEALEATGIPVLVHPYGLGNAGMERFGRYYLRNLVGNPLDTALAIANVACSGVLARHPSLRWCFVHGGGFAPYQLGRWDHGWNVRPETKARISRPPSDYIEACYFDHITHDHRALRFLAERFGWSHVVVGTDYPWDMGTTTPIEDLEAAGLDGSALEEVAAGNARAFLRWPSNSEMSGDAEDRAAATEVQAAHRR